jgi:hypothetical protein
MDQSSPRLWEGLHLSGRPHRDHCADGRPGPTAASAMAAIPAPPRTNRRAAPVPAARADRHHRRRAFQAEAARSSCCSVRGQRRIGDDRHSISAARYWPTATSGPKPRSSACAALTTTQAVEDARNEAARRTRGRSGAEKASTAADTAPQPLCPRTTMISGCCPRSTAYLRLPSTSLPRPFRDAHDK